MKSEIDEYFLDIAGNVSLNLGNTLDLSTIRLVTPPAGKKLLEDSTHAFLIDGREASDDIVLLVSRKNFPEAVEADLARANSVRAQVDADVQSHISSPLFQGIYGTQTYAAFRRLEEISSSRIVRFVQKNIALPRVVAWSASLARQTKRHHLDDPDYDSLFVKPLEYLVSDSDCPRRLREFADQRLDDLTRVKADLWTVVEHGDFGIGNVLFERGKVTNVLTSSRNFIVIDWRGSRDDGYPCIDIIRLLSSVFRGGSRRPVVLLDRYQKQLDISDVDCVTYSALSFGRLLQNLDQFPRENFDRLCERTFDFFEASGKLSRD